MSPKGKKKLNYKSKSKAKLPLIGKLIYLDVKDPKQQKKLQTELKALGAVSGATHLSTTIFDLSQFYDKCFVVI